MLQIQARICAHFLLVGKASSQKGKYKGIALSHSLTRFEDNVTSAETVFRQAYLGLRESCPVSWLKNLESQLLECLETLRSVIPDEVATLCGKLEGI